MIASNIRIESYALCIYSCHEFHIFVDISCAPHIVEKFYKHIEVKHLTKDVGFECKKREEMAN